ncbi:MAG: ZIP family metal transporter [Gammaproteobacteria bacterium]|nr:ZIP family metal transporter [Gammaproteobacteria bacterium]MDH5730034.1 ZIP family metal transporter [Gammaproteobacteria bacterium]
MSILAWTILFSLVGGVLSVIAASIILILPIKPRNRVLPHLVSFAIGSLLSAAFMALLPHALNHPAQVEAHKITITVLFGILGFFVLEKLVLWRHCHHDECEVHAPEQAHEQHNHKHAHAHQHKSAGSLVIIGDAVHNFVDGVLIAAAFLTDVELGIVTAIAVAAHEIPQEVGDFAILLHSGFSRAKAFLFNILASLTTVVGALITYFSLQSANEILPYVLAIAASSFIYVAVADLIPGLHQRTDLKSSLQQVILISLGVLSIYIAHSWLH